jgi:hypothetical protein
MSPFDHLIPATPEERQRELARILATGLLRRLRHVLIPPEVATPQNSGNSSPHSLELRPDLSVTGSDGLT